MTSGIDLNTLLPRTCEAYWNNRYSLGYFEKSWAEVSGIERNGVLEAVLPFVSTAVALLEDDGLRQLTMLDSEDALESLTPGSIVLDINGTTKLKSTQNWMLISAECAYPEAVQLPAILLHEPKAVTES
jgi:hypothetical protein